MRLTEQVALVTGASHGLGLAIAKTLAGEGASVALMARGGAKLDAAVAGLTAGGTDAIAAAADVTRGAEVEAGVKRTIERWGRLDILVLNAGTWQGGTVVETSEAAWDSLLALNLKGAFLALKYSLPWMTAQKRGTVVGIASLGGLVGQPGSAAYAASKWGLRGLLESAALEVKAQRVRVSLVYPHNINSAGDAIAPDSDERAHHLEPAEIASLVGWICTAPAHVSVGNVAIWPIAAGIRAQL